MTEMLRVRSHEVRVFSLANGDANELVRVLDKTYAGRRASSMKVAADARTNSIIVSGAAEDLDVVEALLLRLDQ